LDARGRCDAAEQAESWLASPVLHEGQLASGDSDPLAELVKGETCCRAEVPDSLPEGGKIVHPTTIAKDLLIFRPHSSVHRAIWPQ
jgi:hypothetical protein